MIGRPPCTFRASALAAGVATYRLPTPCRNGHACERYAANGLCIECKAGKGRRNRERKPGQSRARSSRWYAANRESALRQCAERHASNPQPARDRAAAWRVNNRERYNLLALKHCRARQARMASFGMLKECGIFYEIAARVTRCTGIPFEVDHIDPLKGRDRSGLRVPWNLQVLPAFANRRKSNLTGPKKEKK